MLGPVVFRGAASSRKRRNGGHSNWWGRRREPGRGPVQPGHLGGESRVLLGSIPACHPVCPSEERACPMLPSLSGAMSPRSPRAHGVVEGPGRPGGGALRLRAPCAWRRATLRSARRTTPAERRARRGACPWRPAPWGRPPLAPCRGRRGEGASRRDLQQGRTKSIGSRSREKRRAPCRSIGRPALPLLPEGPDRHTARKGDPPAGDQTQGPYGRRGERPGGWWPEAAAVVGASSPMVA